MSSTCATSIGTVDDCIEVANVGDTIDLRHIVPILTCKHSLEYCKMFASRAASGIDVDGDGSITAKELMRVMRAVRGSEAVRMHEIRLTENGFEPAVLSIAAGEGVTLPLRLRFDPLPAEPKRMSAGRFLARAISSCTDFTGSEGWITNTSGTVPMRALPSRASSFTCSS